MTTPWRSLATDPPPEGVERVLGTDGQTVALLQIGADLLREVFVEGDVTMADPTHWQPLPDARVGP